MVTLAVGALGGLLIAALVVGAWIIVNADVLGCGMGACTMATVVFPSTLCHPMPPVLASEALQWPRDIDADTTHNPSYGEVVIYSCVSGIFRFET